MAAVKRVSAAFCCLALAACCLFPLPARAEDDPPAKTAVTMAAFMTPTLLLLPQGQEVESLAIPTDIFAKCVTNKFLQNLSVKWDCDSFASTQTGWQVLTGTVSLPEGYAYYIDGEEKPLPIQQPVWVYSEGMKEQVTASIFHSPLEGSASTPIPLGADDDELEALLLLCCREQMRLKIDDMYQLPCDFYWDLSLIDTAKAGYYRPFVPVLPPGIEIAQADLLYHDMSVLVVDPHKVDLSCMRIDDANPYALYGEWLYVAENPRVWVSEASPLGEGAAPLWLELAADDQPGQQYIELDGVEISASVGDTYLNLFFDNPPESGTYWFQIRYADGQSNYLQVEIDHKAMTAAVPRDGDRFGDVGGNYTPPDDPEPEPPKQEQEAPPAIQPQSPNSTGPDASDGDSDDGDSDQPGRDTDTNHLQGTVASHSAQDLTDETAAAQAVTPQPAAAQMPPADHQPPAQTEPEPEPAAMDGVAFTGAQLQALMAVKPRHVPFRQDDIEVWLPTGALATLAFDDADVVAVRVEYAPRESLTVLVTINNEPVALAEAFVVGIPWEEDAQLEWRDAEGRAIPCEYSAEDGILRLSFPRTGTIYLEDFAPATAKPTAEPAPLAVQEHPLPVPDPGAEPGGTALPIVIGSVLGVGGIGGGTLLWRKRRPKA